MENEKSDIFKDNMVIYLSNFVPRVFSVNNVAIQVGFKNSWGRNCYFPKPWVGNGFSKHKYTFRQVLYESNPVEKLP